MKQVNFSLLILQLISLIVSEFPLSMPINSDWGMVTSINIATKQVKLAIDLKSSQLAVCCRPNRSIFQIIYNFLLNPFFQINQYACPDQIKYSQSNQVVLPVAGIISMDYTLIQAPKCNDGILGLSKQSNFVSYLPLNFKAFSFTVQKRQNVKNQKIDLHFGKVKNDPHQSIVFSSPSPDIWIIIGQTFKVNSQSFEYEPQIVITSNERQFIIPSKKYQKIISYFVNNWKCEYNNRSSSCKCLCNNGISKQFPTFDFILRSQGKGTQILIDPSHYMSIDSNVCEILFKQNTNPIDHKWYISISMFEQKIIYFLPGQKQVIIEQISTASQFSLSEKVLHKNDILEKQNRNQTSYNLWNLPLQLILNCCVVLLLCVFVSLLIVQMIKRISGLSEVDEDGVRGYMLGAIGRID